MYRAGSKVHINLCFRLKKRRPAKQLRGNARGKRKRRGNSDGERSWVRTMSQRKKKRRRREREKERGRERERHLPLKLWRNQRDLAPYSAPSLTIKMNPSSGSLW